MKTKGIQTELNEEVTTLQIFKGQLQTNPVIFLLFLHKNSVNELFFINAIIADKSLLKWPSKTILCKKLRKFTYYEKY